MAQDFSKMSDQELDALVQGNIAHRKGGKSQSPQPQGMTQNPDINALIQKATQPYGVRQNIGDAMSILGGGKATGAGGQDDLSKLYAQEAIKKQFEKPDYVVSYGQDGQPQFTQAPGQIKNAPFYSTQQGGQYYEAKTGQAEAQGEQAKAETGLMNQVMPAVQEAMEENKGKLPPGASVSSGPVTFQPNPRLTDTEQAAVAGSQALEPVVERIMQTVQGGIYGKSDNLMDKVGRTAKQGIADSGIPLLSSQDTQLQSFQSDLNNLKRLIPFTDGGKQLTPFEAKRVFTLLNTMGKNDVQIANDIQAAVSIVMAKGGLAIGGRNAAVQGIQQPQSQLQQNPIQTSINDFDGKSDEELKAELARLQGGR